MKICISKLYPICLDYYQYYYTNAIVKDFGIRWLTFFHLAAIQTFNTIAIKLELNELSTAVASYEIWFYIHNKIKINEKLPNICGNLCAI